MDRMTVEQRRRVLKGAQAHPPCSRWDTAVARLRHRSDARRTRTLKKPRLRTVTSFRGPNLAAADRLTRAWSKMDVWNAAGTWGAFRIRTSRASRRQRHHWYRVPAVVGEAPTLIALATKKSSQSPAYRRPFGFGVLRRERQLRRQLPCDHHAHRAEYPAGGFLPRVGESECEEWFHQWRLNADAADLAAGAPGLDRIPPVPRRAVSFSRSAALGIPSAERGA